MRKIFYWPLFLIFFFFIFASKSFGANIIINEILPDPEGSDTDNEWIELYNPNNPVKIIGYILEDGKGRRFTISTLHTGGSQEINHWLVVYPKNLGDFSLTNTGSEIKLFDSTQSATPVNIFGYSSSKEGKSWARIPDGGAIYSEMLNPTAGGPNQTPSPIPTSTPTPSPSPTPSPTISSTVSPKPSPTPKTTPKTQTNKENEGNKETDVTGEVLGATESGQSSLSGQLKDEEIKEKEKEKKDIKPFILPLIIIGLGLVFLLVGSLPFIKSFIKKTK